MEYWIRWQRTLLNPHGAHVFYMCHVCPVSISNQEFLDQDLKRITSTCITLIRADLISTILASCSELISWPSSAAQRQTVATTYIPSKQVLLFAFTWDSDTHL